MATHIIQEQKGHDPPCIIFKKLPHAETLEKNRSTAYLECKSQKLAIELLAQGFIEAFTAEEYYPLACAA